MTFQALLFCPDEKTARVTTQVLTELEFGVDACTEPFAAVKKLMGQHFDAVVVDCENEQNATLLFKSARNSASNQGALAVAVVEGQAGVANAFRIGANLVLTKPINVEQAKSTLRVARGLLRKGTEAKAVPSAPAATPEAPTRPAAPAPVASAPVTTRPAPPAAAKPVAPVFTPSPMVASAAAAAPASAQLEAKPAPSNASAADLFEAPASAAPAKITSKVPVVPQFSEPPAKTAGSSGKIPLAKPTAPLSPSSSGKVPSLPPKPVLRTGVGMGQTAAAAAPAPARESAKPLAPVFQEKPGLLPQSGKGNPETADNLFETGTRRDQAVAAPSFAALSSGEESEGSAGSRTGIIVAVLLLVLAAAGYFGYTKFFAKKQAAPVPATAPQSQSAPDSAPVTSNNPAVMQAASAGVSIPAPTRSEPQSPPHASAPPQESDTDAEPEVVVTKPAQKSLTVKTDVAKSSVREPQEAASADISAPPVIGSAETSEPAAISSIVQSAPVALPKVAAPQTLRLSQGVTEGLLIKKVPPVYPRQAIQMRVQGSVQLQAVIDKQGRVGGVKVLKGDPVLARAAVDAVNQWRYKPYFLDGQPVDIQTQITVNFKLP